LTSSLDGCSASTGSLHGPWDELLMFVFDGRTLTSEQITGLKLLDGELRAYEFCAEQDVAVRLRPYVWRRVAEAL
jgi:8-oxo-dGTP diphosphatase